MPRGMSMGMSDQRSGLEVIYRQYVSLKETLCGFTFELEHMNGRIFHIDYMKGTPGYRRVVPELVMEREVHVGGICHSNSKSTFRRS